LTESHQNYGNFDTSNKEKGPEKTIMLLLEDKNRMGSRETGDKIAME
jgi:hypothetical protein